MGSINRQNRPTAANPSQRPRYIPTAGPRGAEHIPNRPTPQAKMKPPTAAEMAKAHQARTKAPRESDKTPQQRLAEAQERIRKIVEEKAKNLKDEQEAEALEKAATTEEDAVTNDSNSIIDSKTGSDAEVGTGTLSEMHKLLTEGDKPYKIKLNKMNKEDNDGNKFVQFQMHSQSSGDPIYFSMTVNSDLLRNAKRSDFMASPIELKFYNAHKEEKFMMPDERAFHKAKFILGEEREAKVVKELILDAKINFVRIKTEASLKK